MFLRRLFYYWQFIAALALPLWLLIGASIFGSGGWAVVGVFFGAVPLGLGLLVVSLLFYARKEVRATRTVSWPDVAVLTLWHGLIIGLGFADASSALPLLALLAGLGAFWFAVWELYDAARKRVRAMMDLIDETARGPAAATRPPVAPQRPGTPSARSGRPEIIVIEEKHTES